MEKDGWWVNEDETGMEGEEFLGKGKGWGGEWGRRRGRK